MNMKWKTGSPETHETGVLVLPCFEGGDGLVGSAARMDGHLLGLLSRVVKDSEFSGKKDELVVCGGIHEGVRARRVVLLGLGSRKGMHPESLRRGMSRIAVEFEKTSTSVTLCVDDLPAGKSNAEALGQAAMEGLMLTLYRFERFTKAGEGKLDSLVLLGSRRTHAAAFRRGIKIGAAVSGGVCSARDLANLPGNHGTPAVLAREARAIGRAAGMKVQSIGPAKMKKMNMGSLLSVSLGSPIEPRLIVMEYGEADRERPTVCLVGKGLTFDSGGISIKPSADMDKMRYDKSGGSVVIGAMKAIAELRLPVHVVGIVPASENMPGGNANKPGDIVTASNGKTIQILNTDAEGRLILADALVHAQSYNPDVIIDLATLTGACVVALGKHCAGLMTRTKDLSDRLAKAGDEAFERVWPLPLWDEYIKEMDGDVSDLKNLGGRYGGAMTAGGFLSNFVGDHDWAHLDIAGVSWDDADRPYNKGKGATGFGVRLLVQYLRGLS